MREVGEGGELHFLQLMSRQGGGPSSYHGYGFGIY